jgi:exodeoxyribonuclease VII large subunit
MLLRQHAAPSSHELPAVALHLAVVVERVQRVDELAARLPEAARRLLERLELRLAATAGKLDAISPLKVLGRGYAIAKSGHRVLTRASQVKIGDHVNVRLHEGEINCEVTS